MPELKVEIQTMRRFAGLLLNVKRRSDDALVRSGIIRDATVSGCGGHGTVMLEGQQPYAITHEVARQHIFEILNPDGSRLTERQREAIPASARL